MSMLCRLGLTLRSNQLGIHTIVQASPPILGNPPVSAFPSPGIIDVSQYFQLEKEFIFSEPKIKTIPSRCAGVMGLGI